MMDQPNGLARGGDAFFGAAATASGASAFTVLRPDALAGGRRKVET